MSMSGLGGVAGAALGLVTAATVLSPPAAGAAEQHASWTNERVLSCTGDVVDTYLTPGGFGTPFHVVGSTDVITPKHVEVVFPGSTTSVTTLDVPGFDRNGQDVVVCTYTDPAGLVVTFAGLRA
jgi:hypothetical protein